MFGCASAAGKVETGVRGHVRDIEKLGIQWNGFLQRHAQIPQGALEAPQLLGHGLRCVKVKGNSQVFDDRPERRGTTEAPHIADEFSATRSIGAEQVRAWLANINDGWLRFGARCHGEESS